VLFRSKLPVVRATGQPMRPLLGVESVMLTPGGAKRAEREFRRRSVIDQRRTEKASNAHTIVKRIVTARADPRDEVGREVFFMAENRKGQSSCVSRGARR